MPEPDEQISARLPSPRRKRAGLIGAVVGVAAAGIAAGVAVERTLVRRHRRDDAFAEEPFGMLPYDETLTVTTDDGTVIPVAHLRYTDVDGLPAPEEGVHLVVSLLTAQAAPERTDLLVPVGQVRDDSGRIIGCRGLARLTPQKPAQRFNAA